MKKPALVIPGIWLAIFSFTLLYHQWLSGYDRVFRYFVWSVVFTGALTMILYGFGLLTDKKD